MTYCPMYYMYPLNILLLSQQNQKRNKLKSLCIQEGQCMHLILTFVHFGSMKKGHTSYGMCIYVCSFLHENSLPLSYLTHYG